MLCDRRSVVRMLGAFYGRADAPRAPCVIAAVFGNIPPWQSRRTPKTSAPNWSASARTSRFRRPNRWVRTASMTTTVPSRRLQRPHRTSSLMTARECVTERLGKNRQAFFDGERVLDHRPHQLGVNEAVIPGDVEDADHLARLRITNGSSRARKVLPAFAVVFGRHQLQRTLIAQSGTDGVRARAGLTPVRTAFEPDAIEPAPHISVTAKVENRAAIIGNDRDVADSGERIREVICDR